MLCSALRRHTSHLSLETRRQISEKPDSTVRGRTFHPNSVVRKPASQESDSTVKRRISNPDSAVKQFSRKLSFVVQRLTFKTRLLSETFTSARPPLKRKLFSRYLMTILLITILC